MIFPTSSLFAPKLMGIFLLLALASGVAQAQAPPQLGEAPISAVVGAMTLQEKAEMVVGNGRSTKVAGAAGETHALPRLGIPALVLSDGPAGVHIDPIRNKDSSQTYYATAFPAARLLASTWDVSMVENVGKAYGKEAHEYGVDIALAPGMNIHRNPLGGRNFEYYSEDPVLSGNMAAAMVRGVQSKGVGMTTKHFVANNQESNRTNVDALVSERALREIYLKGFEIAVKESQPWALMSSYNKLNGTYTPQRYDLLTTVLRDEWGFRGFVMTDWTGGDDPVAQMKAGNDLIMPGNDKQIKKLVQAVQSGELEEDVLGKNASRILNIVLKSPSFKNYTYSNQPDLKAHAKVARRAAAQGLILLKNKARTLPLEQEQKVAVFGNTSYDLFIGGGGSGDVNQAYTVQLHQGLTDAGFAIDQSLKRSYLQHIKKAQADRAKPQNSFEPREPVAEMQIDAAKARQAADDNDAAVITIEKNTGEGADRSEKDFQLDDEDRRLIRTVSKAFHAENKKVIVVLNVAGVTEVASWRNDVDALLLAWQPGQEGGHALADVLSGTVNPSGRLATTIPAEYSDVPSSEYFPGKPRRKPEKVIYKEGIYNGYRYYDSFDVQPAYEFGYGLSYTTFSFANAKLGSAEFGGKLKVSVDITNTGDAAGKEVVQLYVSAPGKTLDKPALELKGFAKTNLLKPGESQTVTFSITPKKLASFDPASSFWQAEAGSYTVKIGASSRDIRQTKSFNVDKAMTVEKDHPVLQPARPVDDMKRPPSSGKRIE